MSILIIGATGNQGGAVVRAALERGLNPRALVRDASSTGAASLRSRSVETIEADTLRPDSLQAAFDGVTSVWFMTTMMAGLDAEVLQGKAIIDAARDAGVAHVTFSSVASANRATGIPHFESKWEIEQYLTASGLPATITAPVYFFENLLFPSNLTALAEGVWRQPMSSHTPLQMVALRDIGRLNAEVLARPEAFVGQRIDYAGDALTGEQVAGVLTETLRRPIRYEAQPLEQMRAFSEDMASMYAWFDRVGYSVDLDALHAAHAEVEWTSFATWARQLDWSTLLND